MTNPDLLQSIDDLERHYHSPGNSSRTKISHNLTAPMQTWLTHSSFFILSTCTLDGLDCSPRGDRPGEAFRILDSNTLAIPDRRGNNRIDTLRNLLVDSRVGLLFIVPGIGEALRIKGRASISIAPDLLASFVSQDEPAPATVLLINITAAYMQNARALRVSGLWDVENHTDASQLPTAQELIGNAMPDATS